MKYPIILCFLFLMNFFCLGEEVFKIPFYNSTNVPLVKIENGEYKSGIYYESFYEILTHSKIKFELYPLPKSRSRQNFWEGKSFFSCCENPGWRDFPKEIEVQLFSRPFLKLREFIITRKDKKVKLNDLTKVHFALFRGYSYKGDSTFAKITYLKEMKKMLQFVELERADATIVTEYFFKNYIKTHPESQLVVSKVFSVDEVHVRIHKKQRKYLPVINKSIEEMKKNKVFENIVKNNLK